MTDLSILCAAQMEEMDSSKEEGSSTSAGIKLFKNSMVEAEVDVEVGGINVDPDPESGDGVARPVGGVLNLTVGFTYGRGRLRDRSLRTRNRCKGGNSHIAIQVLDPHDQTPVFLKTIATERKPLACNELGKIESAMHLPGLLKRGTHFGGEPRAAVPTRRRKVNGRGGLSVVHASNG